MRDGAAREHEPDGPLVRRVRRQLIAWSTGSTFVVLLVLGVALYAAVATTLASASENLLRDRAALLAESTRIPVAGTGSGEITSTGTGTITAPGGAPGTDPQGGTVQVVTGADAALPGFAVSGPYAGTLAVIVPADGTTGIGGAPVITSTGGLVPATPGGAGAGAADGPPDPEGFAAAQAGTTTLRETVYQGNPVRVLSVPIPAGSTVSAGSPGSAVPAGSPGPQAARAGSPVSVGVLQVVADRSAELRTLGALLAVLVVGGLVALLVAAFAGSLYATRALVPIRASLRRQREFAADTSHELRTPLAVIRAGVARVRQQPDASVLAVTPTLDVVDAEAVRLGALVDDLLALARTDAGASDLDMRAVDFAEITTDAVAALEPLASARATRLQLDVAPAPMQGDPDRLRRLVTVLVDNAIRHGRGGGVVSVTVGPGRLVVEDDGPGIATDHLGRVFDRFWRGPDAAPGGNGLGLAIAAWIVERHAGRIDVGPSAAGGARFEVSLPGR